MMRLLSRAALVSLALALAAAVLAPARASAADSAVILAYHRFAEDRYGATNIRLEQFEAHLKELTSGPYRVLPIPEIVAALRAGRALPERTVGISLDDGYLSAYREAWPRLKKAGLPFTLFLATGAIDRKAPGLMSWEQIRELKKAGAAVGSHSVSHNRLGPLSAEARLDEIEQSARRIEAELGEAPKLFAYPYGEADLALMDMVRASGIEAAFGQHSGVAEQRVLYYLPRFEMNQAFGGLDRLRQAANAVPLSLLAFAPADPMVGATPATLVTLAQKPEASERLACFAAGEGALPLVWRSAVEFEIAWRKPLAVGPTRLNCTLAAGNGRWRWLGWQFNRLAE
jgi:peptidoglycan/xylan/chitin deacetylase (PgdA/CDA1 family)